MKTKEFIKRVEDLGYDTYVNAYEIEVYWRDGPEEYDVGSVYRKEINAMDTSGEIIIDDDLFSLFIEYAKTPLDEREEKKKYYIISKLIPKSNFKYLCKCCGSTDELWFDVESNVDSKFIQTEIDEIKEKYNTDLKDFEIIEVEK